MNAGRIAVIVARLLLGAVFFVFGLNGFLNFIPMPKQPEPVINFFNAMVATGYLLTLVNGVEVLCGFLLLTGLYVPLALVLLAPVMVNIVLFHGYLTPPNELAMPLVLTALQLFLMWSYRAYYRPLFVARAKSVCCAVSKTDAN